MSSEEKYFERFRRNIIGIEQEYSTPYGQKKIIYCDWIASGRLYKPIEDKIAGEFGPSMADGSSRLKVESWFKQQS